MSGKKAVEVPKKGLARLIREKEDVFKDLSRLKQEIKLAERKREKGYEEVIGKKEEEIYELEERQKEILSSIDRLNGKPISTEPVTVVDEQAPLRSPVVEPAVLDTTAVDTTEEPPIQKEPISSKPKKEKIPSKESKMEIVLPDDPKLRKQLEIQLEEYNDMIGKTNGQSGYQLNAARIQILETILKKGSITVGSANLKLFKSIGKYDQKILFQAFNEIKAHIEGEQDKVRGGTGLPIVETGVGEASEDIKNRTSEEVSNQEVPELAEEGASEPKIWPEVRTYEEQTLGLLEQEKQRRDRIAGIVGGVIGHKIDEAIPVQEGLTKPVVEIVPAEENVTDTLPNKPGVESFHYKKWHDLQEKNNKALKDVFAEKPAEEDKPVQEESEKPQEPPSQKEVDEKKIDDIKSDLAWLAEQEEKWKDPQPSADQFNQRKIETLASGMYGSRKGLEKRGFFWDSWRDIKRKGLWRAIGDDTKAMFRGEGIISLESNDDDYDSYKIAERLEEEKKKKEAEKLAKEKAKYESNKKAFVDKRMKILSPKPGFLKRLFFGNRLKS